MARALRDEELKRIERARVTLRRSARTALVIAFGIPVVIGTLMIWVLVGSGVNDWLGFGLAWGAIFTIFTLPIWGKEGRARELSRYRAFTRDAANGFPVEQVTGIVTWGRRKYARVASAGSRALASPFFSQYWSVPRFWDHFDRLAVGRYDFEILPESGLVVTARPIAVPEVSADSAQPYRASPSDRVEDAVNVALRAAFRTTPADERANAAGHASARQRWRLLLGVWWAFLLLPLLAFVVFVSIELVPRHLRALRGGLLVLVLFALLVRKMWWVLADFLLGTVDCVEGRVHRDVWGKATIHGVTFEVDEGLVPAFQESAAYNVYVFRHSRRVVGAHADERGNPA